VRTDFLSRLLVGAAAVLVAGLSYGGEISSRADLVKLLGGQGTLEAFETFDVPVGTATALDCKALNNAAVCNGKSGQVVPGIDITWGTGAGQWNGKDYVGAPSKEILSTGEPLMIDFGQAVEAFGVDLRAFTNFRGIAQIKVFDADDRDLLGVIAGLELPESGVSVFIGWTDAKGIGSVEFQQAVQGGGQWSPIVDNLQFGTFNGRVPEPSPLLLLALGLVGLLARRQTKIARS
jgi:hypothetical protein